MKISITFLLVVFSLTNSAAHENLSFQQKTNRSQAAAHQDLVKLTGETVREKCGWRGRYSDCWREEVANGRPIDRSELRNESVADRWAAQQNETAERNRLNNQERLKQEARRQRALTEERHIRREAIVQGRDGLKVNELLRNARNRSRDD